MENIKDILLTYISSNEATSGAVVYQPCDGMIEVCLSEDTKQQLLEIVNNSQLTIVKKQKDSTYKDIMDWATDDILIESNHGFLFCLPKNEYETLKQVA